MVYLVFVLYDIYKYIYINVGGKVKYIIRLGEKKKRVSESYPCYADMWFDSFDCLLSISQRKHKIS